MDETNWIDVCRAGTWQGMNGTWVTLTTGDIDAIVEGYNPSDREAPLVFGHPDTDHPAFGWATRFQRSGEILQAKFKQVPDAVKDVVNSGAYKKVSLSLMPDKKTVRHIGLLGATQPAVPGLRNVSFAKAEGAIDIEFAQPAEPAPHKGGPEMKTAEQLQAELEAEQKKSRQLEEENTKLRTDLAAATTRANTAETNLASFQETQRNKAIEARIDKLIADDRLKPADKAEKMMVALSLAKETDEIELAAGSGKKTKLDIYLEGLEKGAKLGLQGHEFSAPHDQDGKGHVDLTKHV